MSKKRNSDKPVRISLAQPRFPQASVYSRHGLNWKIE
jgi:hypothetical protein